MVIVENKNGETEIFYSKDIKNLIIKDKNIKLSQKEKIKEKSLKIEYSGGGECFIVYLTKGITWSPS